MLGPPAPSPPDVPPPHAAEPHRALRLAQRFLQTTREHAVIVTDVEGFVIGWLGAAEHVLGFTEQEMLGRPLAALFTPEDRAQDMPWQELEAARTGGAAEDDRWHLRRDGTAVWVTGAVHAVRDDDGAIAGFVKLMRDRTDLRAHLDQLLHRAHEAESAAQGRTRVLDALGHEMRTPLSALSMAAAVLHTQPGGQAADQALGVIQRQLGVLQRLADDLLEAARDRHGKLRLQPMPADLVALVQDKVDALAAQYAAKGVRLLPVLPRSALTIDIDRVRVQQILANLLDNALKYTPAGGTVWVKLSIETPLAVLRVEDNGVGIAPEVLPRIFELFTQEERSATLAQGGLGIGLALVKAYTELHAGVVEVRSAGAGKGSEFCVRLPLRHAQPPPHDA